MSIVREDKNKEMKVISRKCNIGLNGERYVKGTQFEVDEETGNRLLKQGTVELVDVPKVVEIPKTGVKQSTPKTDEKPEKTAEEEFEKVGGRWRKK